VVRDTRDEPLGREGYLRPAFVLLVLPTLWLLLMFRLPLDVLPSQGVLGFIIVWVPVLLAILAFVRLSMRRLLDIGAPRALAWLALIPAAALPLYIVLAIAPSRVGPGTGTG
jgi:uncharacterized membrane protein YhaH (DUF805 family)